MQAMAQSSGLSRRERQIMDILYARSGATVMDVCRSLPDPPTDMAIRRLLHILEEKGHVKRKKQGREYLYIPKRSKTRAGMAALKHVLDTYFVGALDEAVSSHLASKESNVTAEQLDRIREVIEKARQQGR
jgi:BlaI family transcriptional regulator, penicillinase repressor